MPRPLSGRGPRAKGSVAEVFLFFATVFVGPTINAVRLRQLCTVRKDLAWYCVPCLALLQTIIHVGTRKVVYMEPDVFL